MSSIVFATIAAAMAACGNSAAAPSSFRFDGQWIGTTADGSPISFVVSQDQTVTTLTAGYNFNGCSGTAVFAGLRLAIDTSTTRSQARLGFALSIGPPGGPDHTDVLGTFLSSMSANGSVLFVGYTGCGNGAGFWTATKR